MVSRRTARIVDQEPGWVERRFREVFARLADMDDNKLDSVPGAPVTINQVLNDPSGTAIRFHNEDTWTAPTDDADAPGVLSFTPVPGSLHVRKNGIDLAPTEWTQVGLDVNVPPSAEVTIRAGHKFTAAYAYDPNSPTVDGPEIGTYDEEVMSDGPALFLKLDETAGATAVDSSGNGRDFTAPAGTPTWDQGSLLADGLGTSVSFNGTTSYLRRTYESWMDVSDFTMTFRYKHATSPGVFPFIGTWATAGARGWLATYSGTNLQFGRNNTYPINSAFSGFADGQTYTIAYIHSSTGTGTTRILVDGVEVFNANGAAITELGANFEIARAATSVFAAGQISRVAFWTSIVSDARLVIQHTAAITP